MVEILVLIAIYSCRANVEMKSGCELLCNNTSLAKRVRVADGYCRWCDARREL